MNEEHANSTRLNVVNGNEGSTESRSNSGFLDVIFLLATCVVTGFVIKFPQLFSDFFPERWMLDNYFEKNAGIIVIAGMTLYLLLTGKRLPVKGVLISLGLIALSAVYINLMPPVSFSSESPYFSNSLMLTCLYLPLFLWCVYGFIYIEFDAKDVSRRMDYLKFNGDIAILSALILMAGVILTGMTIGIFLAIDMDITKFYVDYIVVLGVVSAPIVSTFIVQRFPAITRKIAPIIAFIFNPLVLITLVVFLVNMLNSDKDIYNDRNFLLIFNEMLLGVMALIVFSVTETSLSKRKGFSVWMLLLLSVVALVINGSALSAIVYRLGEFGFTPNRTAVLGSNLLIFGNLLWVAFDLFKVAFRTCDFSCVSNHIGRYLPVYAVWAFIVSFGFPLIFGMK